MKNSRKLAVAAVSGAAALATLPAIAGTTTLQVTPVPQANPRDGVESNVLTPSASMRSVAYGSLQLTNPDTANGITHYGYDTSDSQILTQDPHEAYKTEPDKNVYLVMNGHHYLFQGHEGGKRGYVTRIDLDQPDPEKRVTLISDIDAHGNAFPTIDGITWDPYTKQLLLTAESSAPTGGVFGVKLDANGNPVDGKAVRLDALGSGGYEGAQVDKDGNVWLVEDIGGSKVDGGKVPNSYVYRFTPDNKYDLTAGGKLRALEVLRGNGEAVTAEALQSNPRDVFISHLHTYGTSFNTRWVTIHRGTGAFDATAAAANADATPFKRPENGVFRPGTNFSQFYFTETGDTDTNSSLPGRWGGVMRLRQSGPSATVGTLSMAIPGNVHHTGLDNLTFATADDLLVVEDAGDTLHQERNGLDSGFAYHLKAATVTDSGTAPAAKRFLAEGRDASATYDANHNPGYNDGDNEITGIHVSDGDPTPGGLLGAKIPNPYSTSWRTFWTQQHGDNVTWEIHWNG